MSHTGLMYLNILCNAIGLPEYGHIQSTNLKFSASSKCIFNTSNFMQKNYCNFFFRTESKVLEYKC